VRCSGIIAVDAAGSADPVSDRNGTALGCLWSAARESSHPVSGPPAIIAAVTHAPESEEEWDFAVGGLLDLAAANAGSIAMRRELEEPIDKNASYDSPELMWRASRSRPC
jgi:hypothetical protein